MPQGLAVEAKPDRFDKPLMQSRPVYRSKVPNGLRLYGKPVRFLAGGETMRNATIPSEWAADYIRKREGVISIRWTWVCMG